MRHGFIKVAAATPEVRVADCAFNTASIMRSMDRALEFGVEILVFPELCVTGYTCGDLFLQDALLNAAEAGLDEILEISAGNSMVTVVGVPLRQNGKLYNCAAVMQNGRILGIVPKTNVPNYGEFYEKRYFTAAPEHNGTLQFRSPVPFGKKLLFSCGMLPELILGVEVCEDLWVPVPPSVAYATHGATVIANLSASDEIVGKDEYRRLLIQGQSAKLCCAYLYADAGLGESTTDLVFSGHDLIAENGDLLTESAPFSGEMAVTEVDISHLSFERRRMNTFEIRDAAEDEFTLCPFDLPIHDTILTRHIPSAPFIPEDDSKRSERCESILTIQSHALATRLRHIGCESAIIGISGGLDSTLALLAAARAMDILSLPHSNITAVTMPCFGTTKRTKGNAQKLCECLDIPCLEINITAAIRQHFSDIGQAENAFDAAYENAQARERTQVLMDIANQKGSIVIGTGDLSELALGWATYNGDHMSMYGVNGSLPKTLIRYIVKHVADSCGDAGLALVLNDILATPVSPELLPAEETGEIAQKTEDLIGPYELHDFFIYHMIRWGESPDKVLRLALYAFNGVYDKATVTKWLTLFCKRFFSQQFKRSCLPDGPKVGSVTLSPRGDWRMPSDAVGTLWLEAIKK
ncbi:MAG: NAD(+) synthase [Eubacteriales bacterium]|nr:NAD(+) synthase [Eubacteriales bacterium]